MIGHSSQRCFNTRRKKQIHKFCYFSTTLLATLAPDWELLILNNVVQPSQFDIWYTNKYPNLFRDFCVGYKILI